MSSAMARASLSLWVMKMMVAPRFLSSATIPKNSMTSCGVSTAVGSSNTRIFAPRSSTLMISTRCWIPTGRSSTIASGSTASPYLSEISRTSVRAFFRFMMPGPLTGSTPRTTFS